ncbi:MAG: type II secretion system F family protein [Candidatus Glassbacteria bacterium]
MADFYYKARTLDGLIQSGTMAARDQNEVISLLRRRKLIVLTVRQKPRDLTLPGLGSGVRARDIVLFTRQFATMIAAGLPLVQCLEILAEQTERKSFRKTITGMRSAVETGTSLSEALARYPKVFSNLYMSMVSAGEAGGVLDVVLDRLAVYLEKSHALRRKVKGAMAYPLLVMVIAILVTLFLLTFIIPSFARLFISSGMTLPMPTQIVIAMSNFLLAKWHYILLSLFLIILILRKSYKTDAGRLRIDRFLLQIPQIGSILLKSSIARFTRTLGTLIESGVAILDALEITANTSGNKVVQDGILATKRSIEQGDTITEPLKKTGVFPTMVVQMIGVGEKTGDLDRMLAKIADFYEEEVDVAIAALASIIEPVMIVIMGILVGGMVIAMYLPIFNLANAIR